MPTPHYKRIISNITKIAPMYIMGLFSTGCKSHIINGMSDASKNEVNANKSSDNNSHGSSGIVYVTDYGAKDFGAPVECQLDGTNIIVAKSEISNLSVGDNIRIINGMEAGKLSKDLTAKIIAINGENIKIDKECGNSIFAKVYIDSTEAFKTACRCANAKNYDLVIPEGNFYVDCDINIKTNVKCNGKIYTSNKGNIPLFIISRKEEPIKISGSSIAGNLYAGTKCIPELKQYVHHDVIFNSQEIIMWRNNNPGEFYTKNEINRINSDGFLMVEMIESYNDKSMLTLSLYKKERPICLEGLNIMCIENTITDGGKSIIAVRRSDVIFRQLVLNNENLDKKSSQRSGVNIMNAVNVTLDNCKISGFMLDGLGYGVTGINTLNLTLNNTEIRKTRHAVANRHDNYTTINGGSYEGYGGTLDSHWGHNYTVNNAEINGYRAFSYDGSNLTIYNCRIVTDYHVLVNRRMDCPTIKGDVVVKNSVVNYTGNKDFVFYHTRLTDFAHDAEEICNPNLIIENVELVLKNEIPIVYIYAVDWDINAEYIDQKLPKTIKVSGLKIAGENDSKLENTRFRIIASVTNKYYSGNPEVYLEKITFNRNNILDNNIGYDGEIIYNIHTENGATEIPNTYFNVKVKDCGTLFIKTISETEKRHI